ncbi:hypothetical protein [Microbacterium sp. SLBN-146]|uniref:hypothetical protein n=1 Tax=Microbacterium sp. SLBN-146 TaxID=2768457 RepID=UPI0011500048|nr:hypothetical protein [Microbacterium sp. SLBN-146]TQJ29904.1 hypothetical protein FBY39_0347 [Microbacterium sp. SLBN-146]
MSLTVSATGSDRFMTIARALLASLPRTFVAAGDGERGRIVLVEGAEGWIDAALEAIAAGVSGLLVVEPHPVAPRRVLELEVTARVAGTSVRLARQWAGDPAVSALRRASREDDPTTLVDSTAVASPGVGSAQLLVAQIDLVRSAFGGDVRIESLVRAGDGYLASGRRRIGADDAPLLLSGCWSDIGGPRAVARELTFRGRRSVAVGDGTIARASVARVGTAQGDLTLPPINETAYRAALRQLARDLAGAGSATDDLLSYADALTVTADWAGLL